MKNEFDYVLEVLDLAGKRLAQFPAPVNFEPAVEAVSFRAQRNAHPSVIAQRRFVTTIEPLPHPTAGPTYCGGFRVKIEADGAEPFAREFASAYFKPAAAAASVALVKKGVMKEGERFNYLVAAYPRVAAASVAGVPAQPRFTVKAVEAPLPVRDGRLADFTKNSVPFGELLEEDAPTYIPQEIIEQTNALTERARDKETGGILVGHLVRDAAIPDIGIVVTGQIPVRHAQGKSTELTFTPKTWAAMDDAIAHRGNGEVMLGWWHSHPGRYWAATTCAKCPPERRRVCPISSDFFSAHDVNFHEKIFPKAFSLALVVTNTEDGLRQALYGWRDGAVERRGFFIQRNPDRPLQATEAVPTPQEHDHEKTCT